MSLVPRWVVKNFSHIGSIVLIIILVSLLPPRNLPPQTPPPAPAISNPTDSSTNYDDQTNFEAYRSTPATTPTSPSPTPARTAVAQTLPNSPKTTSVIRDIEAKYLKVDDKEYPLRTYELMLTPNDPLPNTSMLSNAKLTQAWDTPVGSHQTLLAVIDTGFALGHEEFSNRWYVSPGESGSASSEMPSALNCTARSLPLSASCNLIDENGDGIIDNESGSVSYQNPSRLNCSGQSRPLDKSCNRIDDDGNGYVDDTTGWDFANYDNSPQAGELNPNGAGTTHGTRVAGIAAATGNNSKGIAGVDWQTKILPIQALDDDSYGDTLGVGRAIRYAAAQGADVISLSLGSDQPDAYVREAVAAATAAGSVVVAASGNDGCECMVYPAHYPEVVSVGALTTTNQRASFTAYGDSLDILAPGTSITSASWTAANQTTAYSSNLQGTSMSTPLVSGLLTRLLSLRPTATPLQLIASLTENTNRLTLGATVSRSNLLGYGSVDAAKATGRVTAAQSLPYTYSFAPVSKGDTLTPNSPTEVSAGYLVQSCAQNQPGSTPLYELTRSGGAFFTISQVEVWQAVTAGYQSKLFAEVCLQQPHDTATSIRSLNLFKEFRNIYETLLP